MPVIQCIVTQLRHISSENAVSILLHMCSISIKYDAKSKAWDILLVLTSVAGKLCNKCPSGNSNKTAVKVILSMQSLVSIKQQSPRSPCDILVANVGPEVAKTAKCVKKCAKIKMFKTTLSEVIQQSSCQGVCQSVLCVSEYCTSQSRPVQA